MKKCSLCEVEKPFDQFHKRTRAKDGLQSRCKSCAINNRMDHYYAAHSVNIQKNKDRARKYYEENRNYIASYLLEHPCVDCGEPDLVVLEFDHVKGLKNFTIGNELYRRPLSRIIEEIHKCEVRCANCHRRRTASRSGWTRQKVTL